mmetsp:Transcript_11691/g.20939  ORF Transcript_11691/g.20939 Transcript_11691/m.20939 type:complete len:110 (+) Transcript_11691:1564-1893(+)
MLLACSSIPLRDESQRHGRWEQLVSLRARTDPEADSGRSTLRAERPSIECPCRGVAGWRPAVEATVGCLAPGLRMPPLRPCMPALWGRRGGVGGSDMSAANALVAPSLR